MRLSDVIQRFTLLSGLEPEEVSKWTVLCVDAMNEIAPLVLPSKGKNEKEERRLSNAAGVYAYYKYCMYTYHTRVDNFSAGMISVSKKEDDQESARRLWEKEKEMCADLLTDERDVCFKGVKV